MTLEQKEQSLADQFNRCMRLMDAHYHKTHDFSERREAATLRMGWSFCEGSTKFSHGDRLQSQKISPQG